MTGLIIKILRILSHASFIPRAGLSSQCQFKLPPPLGDESFRCIYPIAHEYTDKPICIFHINKPNEEEKQKLSSTHRRKAEEIEKIFYEQLEILISDGEASLDDFIDLRGFHFPHLHVTGNFVKRVDFSHATFNDFGDIREPFLRGISSKSRINFTNGASFYNATFVGKADFSNVNFVKEADFNSSDFKREVNFSGTYFGVNAIFSNCHFDSRVDFISTQFKSAAEFDDATFNDYSLFIHSNFQKVNFFGVSFNGTNFSDCKFHDEAYFGVINFDKYVDFSRAVFFNKFDISYSNFPPKVSFDRTDFRGESDFTGLTLSKDGEFAFTKVNLGRASFLDTNLEHITFRDVLWHIPDSTIKAFFRTGPTLWDEFRKLENENERDYEKIAENYRQLVLNYESKRDYDAAEFFHIGEMEMRRRKIGQRHSSNLINSQWWRKLRTYINGYWAYKISSNYGTSYGQAFLLLVAMILFFSSLFLFTGFQPSKENIGSNIRLIEYNLFPDATHQPVHIGQLVSDYRDAVLYSLTIITFQKERWYEPVSWESRLCLHMAMLFLISQAAMFLLAIRRRYKR